MYITGQSSNSEKIRNQKVKGLRFEFRTVANAANTALTMPNFMLTTMKVTLLRHGREYEIMNDTLMYFILASMYKKGMEACINVNFCQPKVAPAAGVIAQNLHCVYIDLGGTIDLRGDDELQFYLSVNSGTYSSAGSTINQTGSTVDTFWRESQDMEDGLPYLKVHNIQPSVTSQTISPGDHVREFVILNIDKGLGQIVNYGTLPSTAGSNMSDANQVISNLTISSDSVNYSLNSDRLNCTLMEKFESPQEMYFRGQCYLFSSFKRGFLDKLSLNFTFNPGLVTATNNVVVTWQFHADRHSLERYHQGLKDHHNFLEGKMAQIHQPQQTNSAAHIRSSRRFQ